MKNGTRDILYLHLQSSERFVMSYGITFREFSYSLEKPLQNLLLLKHQYEDGEYNMNTLLEYVPREDALNLIKEDVYSYGDFCWIDFEDEAGLNNLEGKEIAELLYLGHSKNHVYTPFFRKLNNQFVYLAHDDGWFNKTYYQSLDVFGGMIGNLIPLKLEALKVDRTWYGIRKKSEYAPLPMEVLKKLVPLMEEGIIISFNQLQQTRSRLEIPIWVVNDYSDMDDMVDEYDSIKRLEPNALLIYQRKTKEWMIVL